MWCGGGNSVLIMGKDEITVENITYNQLVLPDWSIVVN